VRGDFPQKGSLSFYHSQPHVSMEGPGQRVFLQTWPLWFFCVCLGSSYLGGGMIFLHPTSHPVK
jgi:hypothetical protein